MTILQDYHPDEEVALYSLTSRYMQLLGVNAEKTAADGVLVLSVDWTVNEKKPVETPKEKLERQARLIQEAIDKIDKTEMKKAVSKVRHRNKEKRTAAQQLMEGFIPTNGKKGRPRKIVTEDELLELERLKAESMARGKGRPRKNPVPSPDDVIGLETCQDSDQLSDILPF